MIHPVGAALVNTRGETNIQLKEYILVIFEVFTVMKIHIVSL
jgi:hypothetical protein